MFGLSDIMTFCQVLFAALTVAAPATGDQAMKLIVPMIALIIVAVVLVVIVIVMANKDKKKKGGKGFKDFDDKDFYKAQSTGNSNSQLYKQARKFNCSKGFRKNIFKFI